MKTFLFLGLLVPIGCAILLPHKKQDASANGEVHTGVQPSNDSSNNASSGVDYTGYAKPMILPTLHMMDMSPTGNSKLPQTFIGTVMNSPAQTADVKPSQGSAVGQKNNSTSNIRPQILPFPPAINNDLVRPQIMQLPPTNTVVQNISLNGTKFLSDIFASNSVPTILVQQPQVSPAVLPNPKNFSISQFFDPAVYNKTNGTLPNLKDLLTGNFTKAGPKLPPFNPNLPQVSPPQSIINPLIPPVPITKNKGNKNNTDAPHMHILPFNMSQPSNVHIMPIMTDPIPSPDQNQMHILPIMKGPMVMPMQPPVAQKPSFDTNMLQGSILMNLVTNLTTSCRNSFISIALSAKNCSTQQFKEKMTNWSVGCDKEDVVQGIFDKMTKMQADARAKMNALVQELPLYLQRFQTLEMNETIPMGQKAQEVMDFMDSINDTHISKTLEFLNGLFVPDMISEIVPALNKPYISPQSAVAQKVNDFRQYLIAKRLQSTLPSSVKNGIKVEGQVKLTKRSVEPIEIVELEDEEDDDDTSEDLD